LGIGRQCESGIAVAETDLGSLHVDLFHHQDRRVRVPQIVEPRTGVSCRSYRR
jgi:hypothetical protein